MNSLVLLLAAQLATACPFCTAVKPTLAQSRDAADVVAIAEVLKASEDSTAELKFHQILKGKPLLSGESIATVRLNFKPAAGSLSICFAVRSDDETLSWTAASANETNLAYFARSEEHTSELQSPC